MPAAFAPQASANRLPNGCFAPQAPADRLPMAALRRRLPRSAYPWLLCAAGSLDARRVRRLSRRRPPRQRRASFNFFGSIGSAGRAWSPRRAAHRCERARVRARELERAPRPRAREPSAHGPAVTIGPWAAALRLSSAVAFPFIYLWLANIARGSLYYPDTPSTYPPHPPRPLAIPYIITSGSTMFLLTRSSANDLDGPMLRGVLLCFAASCSAYKLHTVPVSRRAAIGSATAALMPVAANAAVLSPCPSGANNCWSSASSDKLKVGTWSWPTGTSRELALKDLTTVIGSYPQEGQSGVSCPNHE